MTFFMVQYSFGTFGTIFFIQNSKSGGKRKDQRLFTKILRASNENDKSAITNTSLFLMIFNTSAMKLISGQYHFSWVLKYVV